jgi:hypothetical protein
MSIRISAARLRDDSWGVSVEPPQNYGKGEVLTVELKNGGAYRAVVTRKIWGNTEKELYAVQRLPDVAPGLCPMCGQPVSDIGAKQNDPAANRYEGARPRKPKANGPVEFVDDDVPF